MVSQMPCPISVCVSVCVGVAVLSHAQLQLSPDGVFNVIRQADLYVRCLNRIKAL